MSKVVYLRGRQGQDNGEMKGGKRGINKQN